MMICMDLNYLKILATLKTLNVLNILTALKADTELLVIPPEFDPDYKLD